MSKEESFTRLIKQNEGVIFKVTTLYTNSQVDRQDLYQEIVYQLWKSYDSFREESKISTWMYRVSLNTAIKELKSKSKRPSFQNEDKRSYMVAESYDYEYELRLKKMYEHIYKLNILDRGLILLLLEGKKYEEIADISGLSLTNVSTRLSRIKKKLKSNIQK
ncbi:MAG: sigma-70 family RNA polymerase sigma factor [Eudoraea sp.]|uniref:RNA polymerase sigma factor n=1 Tax=Eudoraea sp. TaxID=1979955 RepID=UPI003C71603E